MYKQLYLDTEWLASVNIMDYSLLLGIYYTKIYRHNRYKSVIHLNPNEIQQEFKETDHDSRSPSPKHSNKKHDFTNYDVYDATYIEGPGRYCIGVIDMLQEWDLNKKTERFIKMYLRGKDGDGISCVEPQQYRRRFLQKMVAIGIKDYDAEDDDFSKFSM